MGTPLIDRAKLLFSTSGTKGDIFPLVGIASELSRRGYQIVFLVNDHYRDLIQEYGFDFRSTGTKRQHIDFHGDPAIWNLESDIIEIGFENYYKQAMKSSCRHVFDQYEKSQILAVVGTYPLLNGATMAADALSIPHTTITLSPRYIPSFVAPPAPLKWLLPDWIPLWIRKKIFQGMSHESAAHVMRKTYCKSINDMRVSIGLDPVNVAQIIGTLSESHLQIATFPDWYGMRQPDWPNRVHTVGFPLFSQVTKLGRRVVDRFISTHGSPLVFTCGTGMEDSSTLFIEGKDICDALGLPGLFVGRVNEQARFSEDRFLHVDYVDFNYVLVRCRLILHHGGIGTLAEAVKAGIPQIIRPLAFDQFDNADRVHRLGLGTFILPEHFHRENVTQSIKKLLDFRKSSRIIDEFSSKVNGDTAIQEACNLIEAFLSEQRRKR